MTPKVGVPSGLPSLSILRLGFLFILVQFNGFKTFHQPSFVFFQVSNSPLSIPQVQLGLIKAALDKFDLLLEILC